MLTEYEKTAEFVLPEVFAKIRNAVDSGEGQVVIGEELSPEVLRVLSRILRNPPYKFVCDRLCTEGIRILWPQPRSKR